MMKISELVLQLEKIQKEKGDILVVTGDDFRNPYFADAHRVSALMLTPAPGGYEQVEEPGKIPVVYIR